MGDQQLLDQPVSCPSIYPVACAERNPRAFLVASSRVVTPTGDTNCSGSRGVAVQRFYSTYHRNRYPLHTTSQNFQFSVFLLIPAKSFLSRNVEELASPSKKVHDEKGLVGGRDTCPSTDFEVKESNKIRIGRSDCRSFGGTDKSLLRGSGTCETP